MSQLGELLRTTREEQGLTLDEVSEKLHIRQYLLQALEENNFDAFPSPVIARGLIRNYARYLKLDPIEALTLYDGNGIVPVKGQRLTPNGIEFMSLSMAPKPLITWDVVIGVILFLAVVGGAGYVAYTTVIQPPITPTPTKTPEGGPSATENEDAALLLPTVTQTPTGTPTPVPPTDTPTPIVYGAVTVELAIKQPSWIQILADDVKVFEGILQPGESRTWTGQKRVAIRAGNAGGVEIYVNGDYKGVMGGEGQVVDQVWEKVDDPALLTPQPNQTNEGDVTNTLLPTETPVPAEEQSAAPAEGETPLPLESAPENAETPLPLDSAPEGQQQ